MGQQVRITDVLLSTLSRDKNFRKTFTFLRYPPAIMTKRPRSCGGCKNKTRVRAGVDFESLRRRIAQMDGLHKHAFKHLLNATSVTISYTVNGQIHELEF
jgi:hypothetical protein